MLRWAWKHMGKSNSLRRAQMLYTYINASGFTVEEVANAMGLTERSYQMRISELNNNNRIVLETGKIIGMDLSFLILERENGRDFRNG